MKTEKQPLVSVPTRSTYEGHPTLIIPVQIGGGKTKNWSFGTAKAQALVKYAKDIEAFVAEAQAGDAAILAQVKNALAGLTQEQINERLNSLAKAA